MAFNPSENDEEESFESIVDSIENEKSGDPEESEEVYESGSYRLPIQGGEYKELGGYYVQKTMDHPKGHAAIDVFSKGVADAFKNKQFSKALSIGKNDPVYPIGSGTVVQVGSSGVSGNFCVIQHPQDPGLYSFYAHLNKVNVSKGEKVKSSTIIGLNGDTGSAKKKGTAPHVHLETWIINDLAAANPINAPKNKLNPESVIGKSYGSIEKRASNKIENIYKITKLFESLVKR